MSARALHIHRVDGHAIGIFDQADSIVAEVGGLAGMAEADAEEMVKRWNEHDGLVAAAGREKFWQAVCIVLTLAYAAGFIEHLVKGCTA